MEEKAKGKTDYIEDEEEPVRAPEDAPLPGKSQIYWLDRVEWGAFEIFVLWFISLKLQIFSWYWGSKLQEEEQEGVEGGLRQLLVSEEGD